MDTNVSDPVAQHAEYLKESTLFRGVDLEGRIELIKAMHHETYQRNDVLFEKGSPGDTVYIILSGEVNIFTAAVEGQLLSGSLTIRGYRETQLFGEFAMIDGNPRSASAQAATDLEVLALHRDDFLRFLKERPVVGLAIMRNLVERVRYTTTYLQRIMDATHELTEGHYDQAEQQVSETDTDDQMQKLIQAFVKMMRSVKEREARLKGA